LEWVDWDDGGGGGVHDGVDVCKGVMVMVVDVVFEVVGVVVVVMVMESTLVPSTAVSAKQPC
jgi:hypothetical protein